MDTLCGWWEAGTVYRYRYKLVGAKYMFGDGRQTELELEIEKERRNKSPNISKREMLAAEPTQGKQTERQ